MVRGWRGWHGRKSASLVALAALALGGLGGCELLYFAGAKSKAPASFKFAKGHRVLVLVELRDGVAAPPAFTTTLADAVGSRLWQDKAVDAPPVRQDQLIAVQQANPTAYASMRLGDIAAATGADDILRIYITQLQTNVTADGTVAEGGAEAYVKVLDKNGDRIWPGDVTGKRIAAQVTTGLISDRGLPEIIKSLSSQLGSQTEAIFHETDNDIHHVAQ